MQMIIKRLCVISYHTCPLSDERKTEIGGMNTYVLELSKALAIKGYFIDIYTRCTEKNSCKTVEVTPNLRVIHLSAGDCEYKPKKKLLQYIPEFSNNLLKFIEKEGISYDLISAHYYLSGLIGLELRKKLKIPLMITFHTLALMKNLVARSDAEREGLQRVQKELQLVKEADRVIATSESDFEYILSLYNCSLKKLALLSPGVNLEMFKPINKLLAKKAINADINHKIILFVGRIAPLKGIDVLLYAVKILIQKHPKLQFCLWVVGEGDTKHLQNIKRLLGITAYVRFVGKKKREQLLNYYNAAEVVLMPSWYESFGIAALEAMACGTPVIVSDVTGISSLFNINHNHLLISAASPIELAKKISNLLTNEKKQKQTGEQVLKKVQNLSWEKVADKFTKISVTVSRS